MTPSLQSLVLISRLPYLHLFHVMLQVIAPEFFDKLEPCLEAGDDVIFSTFLQPIRAADLVTSLSNVLCLQCVTRSTSGQHLSLD